MTSALPHNYKAHVSPATCEAGGHTLYRCDGCGSSFVGDHTDPLGHSWDEGTLITAPTCTAEGVIEYRCTRCGITKLEGATGSINGGLCAPGHGGMITSTNITNSVNGGTAVVPTNHVAGPATTCTAMGYTTYHCIDCGITYQANNVNPLGHHYLAEITEATCTEMGYTTYTCDRCGDSFRTNYRESQGHNWDKGTHIVNSTCNGAGMVEYRCTRCNATRLESESAAGHTPGAPATCTEPQLCTKCGAVLEGAAGHTFRQEVTAPTCTSIGYTTYTCENCKLSYKSDYTNALGHQHKADVHGPTCTEMGYTTYTCDRCGDTYVSDQTDALGHEWDGGTNVVNSTCNGAGMTEYRCVRCNALRLESESATGHTPGAPATCTEPQLCTVCGAVLASATGHNMRETVTNATCTEMGFTTVVCENGCGFTYTTDYTKPLSHHHVAEVTAPTCTEPGHTTYTCDRCGDSYVSDKTEALGHEWDGGTKVVNSTCNGAGMIEYRCVRCDYLRLDTESAAGHTPGAPATCTEPQLCANCGAVLENALGHDYEAEVTAPTCTEMGYTTNTCTRCGDSGKTDYTEPAGHQPSEWIVDVEASLSAGGGKHIECTVCGEILECQRQ